MNTRSNHQATGRAQTLVNTYAVLVNRTDELGDSGAASTLLTDLLADMMHFSETKGIDFQRCIDIAQIHFDAETA